MVRGPYIDKNGLTKGAWSEEEDNKLRAYVQRCGHQNWRQLPKRAGLSRCGKSCRLRWLNYLNPGVKRGNYSVEEEDLIIKLHEQSGNSWSAIAAKLPAGRTDNDIKNYWHTHLSKRMKQDAHSSKKLEQSSEISKHMDGADQHEQSSEISSLDPKQKRELMEPNIAAAAASGNASSEMSSVSWDSTLFEGIDLFAQDSNSSSVEPFTEPSESFWTQPFALDTSYINNNHWLPSVEGEFMTYFSYFLDDDDDKNWLHELFQGIDSNFV